MLPDETLIARELERTRTALEQHRGTGDFEGAASQERMSRVLASMPTARPVGILANTKARLIHRDLMAFDDRTILEMVIWEVPPPVEGSSHCYKCRLLYGYAGSRVVGYDNERPKGDHRHVDGVEEPYQFTTPEDLIREFIAEVTRRRAL